MQQQPTASNLGIGPDFILFDDAPRVSGSSSQSGSSSSLMPMATPGAEWSSAWGSGSSQIEVPSLRAFTGVSGAGGLTMPAAVSARPSMGESNASFTQYRAPSTNAAGAMQQQPESPFSSPASRPDDDFGVGATINPKSGAPNRKRARPAGYSSSGGGGGGGGSSSSGWGHTRMLSQGSLGSQGSAADWISEASSTSPHAPTNGFAAMQPQSHRMTQQGSQQGSNAKGVDWLSDTSVSPQQPPSGSFGPPIQSLNLGDAGPSLFPGSGAAPTSEAEAAQARALFALSLSNSNPNIAAPTSAASYQPGQGVDWTSTVPGAAGGGGGVAQADRVRQQVRADLMGVDPRALKGPLRDIQQGGAPALRQGGGRPEARPVAPRRRSGSLDSAMPVAMPDMSWMQWTGPTFAQATPSGAPAMETTQSWDGTPTQQFSTQLSSYLDAFAGGQPLPQHHVQHAQHAQQQQQQQVQQQRRSSLQVGHADGRPRMSRDRSGLTVSPHETLLDWDASNGRAFSLFPGLSDSLVGRVRATAAVPTPKRAPLDRNETARPSPQQQAAMAHQQQQQKQQQQHTRSEAPSSSQQSSGSLFSPTSTAAFGGETPSSEEEDEARLSTSTSSVGGAAKSKGFNAQAPAVASSLAGAGIINGHAHAHAHAHAHGKSSKSDFPFPPQQAQGLHLRTAGSGNNGVGVGPRFGDVSSSSSEDEGDSVRGRRGGAGAAGDAHVQRQRQQGMGGYGYMAGSAESGLSVVAPGFLSVPDSTGSGTSGGGGAGGAGATSENAAEARRRSDSQSNDDDGGASPSIRSSAQAIPAPQRVAQGVAATEQGAANQTPRQRSVSRARASGAQASGDDEGEWEEEEEEDADDGSDEGSDYEAGGATTTRNAAGNSGARKRRRRPKGASSTSTTNAASSSSASSGVPRLAAGLPKATNAPSSSGMHSATNAAGITTCDYVSKATHEYCGTEFHRPYDLARHRETIHGKEEAQLLRLGKIKKEDCAVLYREVDPAKSLATVEWKCDGKNGCGSVFSRKDALLRHRRIRAHGK